MAHSEGCSSFQECGRRNALVFVDQRLRESWPPTPPHSTPPPPPQPQLPLETVQWYRPLVSSTESSPPKWCLSGGGEKPLVMRSWVLLYCLCLSQDLGWRWFHSKIKFPAFCQKAPGNKVSSENKDSFWSLGFITVNRLASLHLKGNTFSVLT